MRHRTPTKVTFEFSDGTAVVLSQAVGGVRSVFEARTYVADFDADSLSSGDERYTALFNLTRTFPQA